MSRRIPTMHASILLLGIVVVLLVMATRDAQIPSDPRFPITNHPLRRTPRPAPPSPVLASVIPIVEIPQPDAAILGIVTIRGTAPGPWFFEGSFPVNLVDENGGTVATTVARAENDWMTVGDVRFTAELDVPSDTGGPGTIILQKNNPSGLPEDYASFKIPVVMLRDTTPRTDL